MGFLPRVRDRMGVQVTLEPEPFAAFFARIFLLRSVRHLVRFQPLFSGEF